MADVRSAPGSGRGTPVACSGVLPVDKPEGPTSHDVVAMARRALRTRRIGHTGTLDPFASGLLLLCLGPATRLSEYLTALPKTYRAVMTLGAATDTDDRTGRTLHTHDAWRFTSSDDIRAALGALVGTIEQVPPRFSAKKVEGERMYVAARRGDEVDRAPARVTIYRIDVLDVRLPEVEFEVECSSGTYIRAIARDVGEALGVGAHLSALRRTRVGDHTVAEAVATDALADPERVRRALLSPLDAVSHLPQLVLDEAEVAEVSHGRPVVMPPGAGANAAVALSSSMGELLAIGEVESGVVRPRKVFI
jgi:tRNA pseudouridine55 synthase